MLRDVGGELGGLRLPTGLDGPEPPLRTLYSNRRAASVLGLRLRPLEETVADMARDLIRRKIVTAPQVEAT